MRHSEMHSISERLGRVADFAWATIWVAGATLMGGALLGGLLGLIPFLSTTPRAAYSARLIYFGVLGVAAILTLGCVAAALTTHKERADSISAIKADFDNNILGTFEEMPSLSKDDDAAEIRDMKIKCSWTDDVVVAKVPYDELALDPDTTLRVHPREEENEK